MLRFSEPCAKMEHLAVIPSPHADFRPHMEKISRRLRVVYLKPSFQRKLPQNFGGERKGFKVTPSGLVAMPRILGLAPGDCLSVVLHDFSEQFGWELSPT